MARSQLPSQSRIQLSAQEMRDISQQISREFAPRRFRAGTARKAAASFSPSELLAISQQISREFAPRPLNNRGEAKLVALPVDPEHLYVYWQLDEPAQISPNAVTDEPANAIQPLTLRVFNQTLPTTQQTPVDRPLAPALPPPALTWFDVPANTDRRQQQIELPSDATCIGGMYQVAIGRLNEHQEFKALAYSNSAITLQPAPTGNERLPPAMAAFIMLPSQASSTLTANASGQQN